MTKLCNFIEAVYLPWKDVCRGFRPYQEVLAELKEFKFGNDEGEPTIKTSFINKHILRTIGFALNNKGVSSGTKKMIHLIRYQFFSSDLISLDLICSLLIWCDLTQADLV